MKKSFILIFLLLYRLSYGQYSEQTLKNVFVVKFVQFIEWPEDVLLSKDSFKIVLFTSQKLLPSTIKNYTAQRLKGKPVMLIASTNIDDIEGADVIYVMNDQEKMLDAVAHKVEDKPQLIITDFESEKSNFHLSLLITSELTIQFEINPHFLQKNNLTPASALLNMGKIVED